MSGRPQEALVLVTGGTGTVGRSIARRLLTEGYRVRVYARHASRDASAGMEAVDGDIQDARTLGAAASGASAVVHVVGILRERPGQSFQGVHVLGTRNAVTAARQAGARRLIHVGGVRAAAESPDLLSRTKGLAEEEVRRGDIDFTILRSSMVFGVEGGVIDRIAWSLNASPPAVLLPRGGRGLFQPLWIEDLASCVVACLRGDRWVGESYDLGGPETWSYQDLVRLLMRRRRVRRLLVPVPLAVLAALAGVPRLVGREPFATYIELLQLCMDNRTDPAVLPREFGIVPARLEEKLTPGRGES